MCKILVVTLLSLLLARAARAEDSPPSGSGGATPATRPAKAIERADVDALVRPLVDGGWCAGVAVGVVDRAGARVFGYGSAADGAAPEGRTLYEIGSASKTFTSLLLAAMAREGRVSLDDPAQKYLPDAVKLPRHGGKDITLLHLATHTSGLPRMPDNFTPKDPTNPYADYTVQQMYAFLSGCEPARDPGEKYEYSNLGAGLLGHLLALRAGEPYEKLLARRICGPLGMNDTVITLADDAKRRLAPGHDGDGNPVANWDIPTLAGAGAIRSTADDLLKYLAAQTGLAKGAKPEGDSPALGEAIADTHVLRAKAADLPDTEIALAWHVDTRHGLYWHNGQTGGYHSFLGFCPGNKTAVVLLTNTGSGLIDAAGMNLLKQSLGVATQTQKLPRSVPADPKWLDRYAGAYRLAPFVKLTITRGEDQLYAQLTGQPKFRIYPESEKEFFWKVVPARLTFETDAEGRVTKATLHQNGRDVPATPVATDPPGR